MYHVITKVGSCVKVVSKKTSDLLTMFINHCEMANTIKAIKVAATAFYSAKSRNSLGLGGLASCGVPDYVKKLLNRKPDANHNLFHLLTTQ